MTRDFILESDEGFDGNAEPLKMHIAPILYRLQVNHDVRH